MADRKTKPHSWDDILEQLDYELQLIEENQYNQSSDERLKKIIDQLNKINEIEQIVDKTTKPNNFKIN